MCAPNFGKSGVKVTHKTLATTLTSDAPRKRKEYFCFYLIYHLDEVKAILPRLFMKTLIVWMMERLHNKFSSQPSQMKTVHTVCLMCFLLNSSFYILALLMFLILNLVIFFLSVVSLVTFI